MKDNLRILVNTKDELEAWLSIFGEVFRKFREMFENRFQYYLEQTNDG